VPSGVAAAPAPPVRPPLWASLVAGRLLCMRRADIVRCCGEPMPGWCRRKTGWCCAGVGEVVQAPGFLSRARASRRRPESQAAGRRTLRGRQRGAPPALGACACTPWCCEVAMATCANLCRMRTPAHARGAPASAGLHQGSQRPRRNHGQRPLNGSRRWQGQGWPHAARMDGKHLSHALAGARARAARVPRTMAS